MISKCSYPCNDINRDFIYPDFTGNDKLISIVMISEAPPVEHSEYYYQSKDGAFFKQLKLLLMMQDTELNHMMSLQI